MEPLLLSWQPYCCGINLAASESLLQHQLRWFGIYTSLPRHQHRRCLSLQHFLTSLQSIKLDAEYQPRCCINLTEAVSTSLIVALTLLLMALSYMKILKCTVKAPNFDRVFMKKIFFLQIFVGWPPLKKIDRACKIKVFKVPKPKFLFWGSYRCKGRFSEGVEVTIWAANFDRYK